LHATESLTGTKSGVCGMYRIARRATMQPLSNGGLQSSTFLPYPAVTRNATSSVFEPLGTRTSVPIRPVSGSHRSESADAGLFSRSAPSTPTATPTPSMSEHFASVVIVTVICVGSRQDAASAKETATVATTRGLDTAGQSSGLD
jgi:hypothetical protein